MSKRILLIDDDTVVLRLYEMEMELRDEEVEVDTAQDGLRAIEIIETAKHDVIVLDLRLPKADGFAVLQHLHDKGNETPVIVLTNYDKEEYRQRCSEYSVVQEYLQKRSIPIRELMEKLQRYLNGEVVTA